MAWMSHHWCYIKKRQRERRKEEKSAQLFGHHELDITKMLRYAPPKPKLHYTENKGNCATNTAPASMSRL